ncbi:hypothetical protein NRW34_004233 [Salmonella enterica]|nr:hypothetical protein [Salmonella enterica]
MASGLQCWNASGVLVADLTDYNMRYVGTTTLGIGTGTTTSWNVGCGGMRPTGWLAIVRQTYNSNDFYCIPYNDSFVVQYLPVSGVYAQTLIIDIYTFE